MYKKSVHSFPGMHNKDYIERNSKIERIERNWDF
jgi:hypothetical protein